MRNLELTNRGVKIVPSREELEATIVSFIYDYQLAALCLKYERKDAPKEKTVSFTFWLSGQGVNACEEYILMHLNELPVPFPAFVKQLQEITSRAGILFRNTFADDGYEIHCNAIHRRIIRKR